MEIRKTGLHRQNSHEQKGCPVHPAHGAGSFHLVHRCIDNAAGQIRKCQAEEAPRKQRGERRAESQPVRAKILKQSQCLPERFPDQLRPGKLDSRLIIA